jgi:hypothetical protein
LPPHLSCCGGYETTSSYNPQPNREDRNEDGRDGLNNRGPKLNTAHFRLLILAASLSWAALSHLAGFLFSIGRHRAGWCCVAGIAALIVGSAWLVLL